MVNLPIEFTDKLVTPSDGMSLLKLGIREQLNTLNPNYALEFRDEGRKTNKLAFS